MNYKGYLFCPDYYLICSGTKLCNNMFDCVKKESSLKNNIEYDYTIRTSQDINTDEDYTNEAYELDTEGKCPQFCSQCDEDCECIKCGNEYGIVYNEQDKKICKSQSELSSGYYKENEIYYKCLEHCSKCTDNTSCEECNSEYAFEKDNHYICYPKSMFDNSNYYTKDNGKSYYNCNYIANGIKGIENCNECIYQNNELLCKKCTNGYIVVNGDMKECKSKANYIAEYYEDPNDSNNYLSCSDLVKNCASCTYEGCTSCKKGYIMLNDNKKKCFEEKKTDLSKYYTNDNKTYYSCSDYKYKSDIQCFSILPKQNIILTFLQVQIIKPRLVCYIVTHSPLPQDFSLKLNININKKTSQNARILSDGSINIVLKNEDESNGSTNSIIGFYSDENTIFNTGEEIQVNEISFNNDDSNTNKITSKNDCILEYDKTSSLLNTKIVSNLILSNKIPDYSSIQSDSIVEYELDEINGCNLKFNSDDKTIFYNNPLYLELEEYDNNKYN